MLIGPDFMDGLLAAGRSQTFVMGKNRNRHLSANSLHSLVKTIV
ncbi:MAG: hypothetical protein WBC73_21735 [Phormidesmis sp.]